MASEFKLPTLGENVTSGTVGKVLVAKGDTVAENQPVVEIETDKAVAEIPCDVSGTVLEVKVKEGQTIKVGQVIFTYKEGAGAKKTEAKEEKTSKEEPKEEAGAEKAPAKEAPERKPAEKKTEPKAPPRLHVLDRPTTPSVAAKAAAAAATPVTKPYPQRAGHVTASPSVRRMARELGLDLSEIPTSDPAGRISAEDVQRYARGRGAAAEAPAGPAPAAEAPAEPYYEVQQDKWGPVAVEPMNNVRKKTAEFMTHCWTTIPHVTHFEKADITEIESLRKKYGKKVEAAGGKLTVTSFLLKIAAEALKRFPKFNSSLDFPNQQVLLKEYYHIGVAADTEYGLLVPVIRDVDQKSVLQLSVELPALAEKARARKLSLEEMQGGTFTISNLGGLGGTAFTPIISAPQVAILEVSRSQSEPVFINGQFSPRVMLPLTLSYDHRVIDGAGAARFLRWFAEALEQP
ncbi:MAG: 2-oxo acid dehydrogenase subunit E2, partial [Candidatus Hydrogenedentes bacterium]|nr:2-oxo acid dehydrogenase subunit E2 [Candidatus Hydrogenedentota bacterium]